MMPRNPQSTGGFDCRIPGASKLIPPGSSPLRIPDEILKCVAFTAYAKGEERHLNGTAFFVIIPDKEYSRFYGYIVSARHVIEQVSKNGDGQVYLRVNRKDNSTEEHWLTSDVATWKFHPTDPRIDVAAVELPGWPRTHDHVFYPTTGFATADVVKQKDIGIGDELFFPGLFVRHFGKVNNIPIARLGNIASMPSEPAPLKTGWSRAYLVEARSIGGLSGSPVFVYLPSDRDGPDGPFDMNTAIPLGGGDIYLLGLVHGHWDAHFSEDRAAPDFIWDKNDRVNMGIGVVVPADQILEVLNQECFAQSREDRKQAYLKSLAPEMD